MSEKLFKILT